MNNKKIYLISGKNWVEVKILNGQKKPEVHRFLSMDGGLDFVLLRGDRHTEFKLNGYPCRFHAWTIETASRFGQRGRAKSYPHGVAGQAGRAKVANTARQSRKQPWKQPGIVKDSGCFCSTPEGSPGSFSIQSIPNAEV